MCDSTQGHIGIGGTEATCTALLVYSLAVVIKLLSLTTSLFCAYIEQLLYMDSYNFSSLVHESVVWSVTDIIIISNDAPMIDLTIGLVYQPKLKILASILADV